MCVCVRACGFQSHLAEWSLCLFPCVHTNAHQTDLCVLLQMRRWMSMLPSVTTSKVQGASLLFFFLSDSVSKIMDWNMVMGP